MSSQGDRAPGLTSEEEARWQHIGSLAAVAIVLGYLETFIPLPILGAKLGLANIPVLMALAQGDARGACAVAGIKVLANALLFGNPVTIAYSAAGTALSLLAMAPLSRLKSLRLEMLSVAGATAHAAGQLLVAQAMLGTKLVWYSAPPLVLVSWITGWLCGGIAARSCELIGTVGNWNEFASEITQTEQNATVDAKTETNTFQFYAEGNSSTCPGLPKLLVRSLAPVLPMAVFTLVAQLFTLPAEEALRASAIMVARLALICLASACLLYKLGRSGIERVLHLLLKPLGTHAAGPTLALETALALIPQLAAGAQSAERPKTLAAWKDALPQMIAATYAGQR